MELMGISPNKFYKFKKALMIQTYPSPCNLISLMNSMMNRFVWDDDNKQYETHGGIDE
jgi:hypothetical protein